MEGVGEVRFCRQLRAAERGVTGRGGTLREHQSYAAPSGGLRQNAAHYGRVERNAFTLAMRGSFSSRLYSDDSTAISATLPSALLCMPHP